MHEAERVGVAFVSRVLLAAHLLPVLRIHLGEMGVGRHFGIDPGQVQVAGLVEQLPEDLAPPDDAQLARALAFGNHLGLVQRRHRAHAYKWHLAAAGQHQVGPPRQHAADRFGGLPGTLRGLAGDLPDHAHGAGDVRGRRGLLLGSDGDVLDEGVQRAPDTTSEVV
ncbi:hypothetical protein G6F35_017204 [Rhizopus arrhizus]|nr:hypothetical protein G6F35_017204 [Rhizopus arrhizus]